MSLEHFGAKGLGFGVDNMSLKCYARVDRTRKLRDGYLGACENLEP